MNIQLLTYDEFLFESEINEAFNLEKYKDIFKKVKDEVLNNFKFINTFGAAISVFFPIVDNFIKNQSFSVDVTPTNIVLATLCTVSLIVDNNKSKIKEVIDMLKDKEWVKIINLLKNAFLNIFDLFKDIANQSGKVIKSFYDMFTYTMMFVPFFKALLEFVQTNSIKITDFDKLVITFGTGVAMIAGKNIFEYIINNLKKNSKLKFATI